MGSVGKFFAVVMIGIIGIIIISSILGTSKGKLSLKDFSLAKPSTSTRSTSNSSGSSNVSSTQGSSYRVSISSGNASSENKPSTEYITIKNGGREAIDITGWTLKNSKGNRPINVIGDTQIFQTPDVATVPQGAEYLNPNETYLLSDIILKPGETAVINSGKPFAQFPFSISVSFRENICTGYLKHEGYPFNPKLDSTCPLVREEEGTAYTTEVCYNYIKTLSKCENPEKTEEERFELQKESCQDFIAARANYPSCVALHNTDADFYGKKWRVFLSRNFEMWGRDDTIYLYDRSGTLVGQRSY